MASNRSLPNAWDDDWEAQADRDGGARLDQGEDGEPKPATRRERLARHAEAQRMLWESADAADKPQFLPASNPVPLATGFKPAMKVLSRKPAPKMITRRDPLTGMERLVLEDEGDDEEARKAQPTPEEIKQRLQRERDEKQRRYDEARAKIFGDTKSSSPGSGSPGSVTPPQQLEGRQPHRGRGRGRGGGEGVRNAEARTSEARHDLAGLRPSSSQLSASRELYDPNYEPKPAGTVQKHSNDTSRTQSPRQEQQARRAPRGPDVSGRGGFSFARRGAPEK